jgi:iron complex transport system ATP-binding protein
MTLAASGLCAGHRHHAAVRGVTLDIRPGERWAVLGNNGTGKSTLLHTLAGILPPLEGTALLDGNAVATFDAGKRARRIGLLLQEEPLEFWGSVREYVRLGRYPHRRGQLRPAADDDGIVADQLALMELNALAQRPLARLSGGERQRARLALVLAQQPVYYLLDEPLQHLDLRHGRRVLDHFARLATGGAAVVMVLHDPVAAAHWCDHALLVYEGEPPLAGPDKAVLTQSNLERLYGVAVTL